MQSFWCLNSEICFELPINLWTLFCFSILETWIMLGFFAYRWNCFLFTDETGKKELSWARWTKLAEVELILCNNSCTLPEEGYRTKLYTETMWWELHNNSWCRCIRLPGACMHTHAVFACIVVVIKRVLRGREGIFCYIFQLLLLGQVNP